MYPDAGYGADGFCALAVWLWLCFGLTFPCYSTIDPFRIGMIILLEVRNLFDFVGIQS